MSGTLYGVGVGPGDPELMTLKAHRLISTAPVVAYPAPDRSVAGGASFARSIAAASIRVDAIEIPMVIPMAEDRYPAQEAYDRGAAEIEGHLEAGRDVVVLCEGDPMFYGSFMYLHARLAAQHAVQIVPGVTSLTGCAAALGRPLSARNETLTVIPGPLPEAALKARIEAAEAVAIMKVGRHLPKIVQALEELGLVNRAGYVERASLPNQIVKPLSEAPENAPYFSMILVLKGGDPWLT